jgi:hypothetical protein
MTTPYHDDEDSPFDERGILRDGGSVTVRMCLAGPIKVPELTRTPAWPPGV